MTYQVRRDDIVLTAQTIHLGKDLCVLVTGGACHIGSVSAATPRPSLRDPAVMSATASTFCYPGHKDNRVGDLFAERLSAALEKKVVALCGIHYDALTPAQIETVVALSVELLEQTLRGERS